MSRKKKGLRYALRENEYAFQFKTTSGEVYAAVDASPDNERPLVGFAWCSPEDQNAKRSLRYPIGIGLATKKLRTMCASMDSPTEDGLSRAGLRAMLIDHILKYLPARNQEKLCIAPYHGNAEHERFFCWALNGFLHDFERKYATP